MPGHVSENRGTDRLEDVVKRRPTIHPSHLVSAASQRIISAANQDVTCLAIAMSTGFIVRRLLYGSTRTKLGKDFADRRLERAVDRAATRAFVAAAPEALSKFGHVHLPFAAQAHAEASIRQFTEKHR